MDPSVQRVAIYRIGHIGDMVVALPAFWTVRKFFPNAKIVLLTKERKKGILAQGMEVFRLGTVYDELLAYRLGEGGTAWEVLHTLLELRARRIQVLVYLPASGRSESQMRRDRLFFKLAGVRKIVGMEGLAKAKLRPAGSPLPWVTNEVENLVGFIRQDGVTTDEPLESLMDMGHSDDELADADAWLASHELMPHQLDGPLIGMAPSSKMLAKLWPTDRFIEVAKQLSEEFHATFVLFGAPNERELCQQVADSVPRAVNAAGDLTVRQSGAVLRRFQLYIGNDTGTMHIAVAAGVPCVGLFSARDWPGRWFPYGPRHTVLRQAVPCEGCMLETCDKDNLCLTMIDAQQVIEACRRGLGSPVGNETATGAIPEP